MESLEYRLNSWPKCASVGPIMNFHIDASIERAIDIVDRALRDVLYWTGPLYVDNELSNGTHWRVCT